MMKKHIAYLTLLLFASAAATGCLKDSHGGTGADAPAGFVEIEFTAAHEAETVTDGGTGGLLTRAALTDEQRECYVDNIDILVFKRDAGAGGGGKFLYATHGYDIDNSSVKAKKFKAMLATTVGGNPITDEVFIIVIANSRMEWETIQQSYHIATNDSFTKIIYALTYSALGNWDTVPPRFLPMASRAHTVTTLSAATKGSDFGAIILTRSVAAFDVGFNYEDTGDGNGEKPQGFPNFELAEVVLCNAAYEGFISSDIGFGLGGDKAQYDGNGIYEYTLDPTSAKGMFNRIYVPEMAASQVADNHLYMLIAGYYNDGGDLSWYKVELPGESGQGMSIQRNYRYTVKIYKINGPGCASREEAEAGGPNIWANVTAVPWTHVRLSPEPGGDYCFDVSQTSLFFENEVYYGSNDTGTIDLYTDYREGWKVDEVTYDVDPGGYFWLRTDVTQGVPFADGQLTITITRYNNTGDGRIAYVHLSAGRWKYKVKVQQGEIVNMLAVTPSSRTLSPWSYINGQMPQNTFRVDCNGDWTISDVSGDWLTAYKIADGSGFYVQCGQNTGTATRTASVTVTSGSRSVTVPVTQDWADCGTDGNTVNVAFGNGAVKTHLFGGNPWGIMKRSLELQSFTPEEQEQILREWSFFPDKEYYACWMVENSTLGTPDQLYYDNDTSRTGPYYSYANAPTACPDGWRLPGFYDMFCLSGLWSVMSMGSAYNSDNEMRAWDAWIRDPNTFAGGHYNASLGDPIEWREWGNSGLFYIDWDGILPNYYQGSASFTPQIAVITSDDPSSTGYNKIDAYQSLDPNSLLPVRCVRDVTYIYE